MYSDHVRQARHIWRQLLFVLFFSFVCVLFMSLSNFALFTRIYSSEYLSEPWFVLLYTYFASLPSASLCIYQMTSTSEKSFKYRQMHPQASKSWKATPIIDSYQSTFRLGYV